MCTAHGSPTPEVEWILADGSPAHQVQDSFILKTRMWCTDFLLYYGAQFEEIISINDISKRFLVLYYFFLKCLENNTYGTY